MHDSCPARYFEIEVAREVVIRRETIAVFVPGFGARCTLCGEPAGTRSGFGDGRRYHICPSCGNRFYSCFCV